MSTDDARQLDPAPAEAIEGFPHLDVAQTGNARFTVTDRSEEEVYEVRLSPPECDCDDADPGQACEHILMANYHAPQTIPGEQWALQVVASEQREMRRDVKRVQDLLSDLETDTAPARGQTASSERSDNGDEPSGGEPEKVAKVKAHLEEQGIPVEKIRVWEDDQYGSVQLEPAAELGDAFDDWKRFTNLDSVWYDSSTDRNYITADNVSEVVS